jgi:hypothetical protein
MGGGGGGKPKESTPPPQAQPIDYGAMMAQASVAAKEQYRDQLNAQIEAYPKLERLQLGTVSNFASNLSGEGGTLYENKWIPGETTGKGKNKKTTEGRWEKVAIGEAAPNLYTRRATDQLIAAEDQATQLGRIGDYTEQLGYQAAQDLEGTDIERELGSQALRELQLGRSLSPEQERQAAQQARAGMSARGLGVGNAALAAEILNRDSYASQREAERRNFAGSTNQMLVGNRQNRIGMVGNILGQSANTRMNQANLRSSLAGANITIDPYARAMNPALGMGSTTLGQSGQMIGNTYNTATQMAGNVASFNANMQQSERNTVLNNNAALQGAYLTSGATNNAGWMSMIGGMAQGAGSLGGGYLQGKYSDRRMKKDIKPIGKGGAGGLLGLTAYEFRYKDGDDRKHIGFMAQDVQKVLPEAVEEVDYKGQRRLAIKPKVIGDAIAEILADGQAGLFDKGYTVGSGRK